jgi:hypothetical protein
VGTDWTGSGQNELPLPVTKRTIIHGLILLEVLTGERSWKKCFKEQEGRKTAKGSKVSQYLGTGKNEIPIYLTAGEI